MEHIWGFMTSLAPADLRGKSLSNDTLFHFYTDALALSSSITVYTILARRRSHPPHVVHCLTHSSRPDTTMIVSVYAK